MIPIPLLPSPLLAALSACAARRGRKMAMALPFRGRGGAGWGRGGLIRDLYELVRSIQGVYPTGTFA